MGFWLVIALIALLLALIPWWPYSRRWGWRPSMGVLVLVALLLLLGWVRAAWM